MNERMQECPLRSVGCHRFSNCFMTETVKEVMVMAHSQETKEKFVALRAEGMSYERIGAGLGVSKQTLVNWGKQLADQISKLRESRIDEL